MAFSITPWRVKWKSAIASPFLPTVMFKESAANASTGVIRRNARQNTMQNKTLHRVRAIGIMDQINDGAFFC